MRRLWLFTCLLILAAGSLFLLIYPLTIIQPFLRQAPDELLRALFVFRIAPTVSLVIAACALLITLFSWNRQRRGARFASVGLLVVIGAATALVRVNVFEQLFHPAGTPRFLSINDAKIQPDDMLIAVALNGESHAYPIREMAYHHVVNDFVGSVPVVATY
jgi:hypothetical protein